MPDRYVALFRGINVGKAKRIAMADLRALLESLGYTRVRTLLNSGNAVFDGATAATTKHAQRIQAAVLAELSVDALVIVKSAADIHAAIDGNTLRDIATDPSRLIVAFTKDATSLAALQSMADTEGAQRLSTSGNTRRTCGAPTASLTAKWRSQCSKIWRNQALRATRRRLKRFGC